MIDFLLMAIPTQMGNRPDSYVKRELTNWKRRRRRRRSSNNNDLVSIIQELGGGYCVDCVLQTTE